LWTLRSTNKMSVAVVEAPQEGAGEVAGLVYALLHQLGHLIVCHEHRGIIPVSCCRSMEGAARSKSVSGQVATSLAWVGNERERDQESASKAAAVAMEMKVVAA